MIGIKARATAAVTENPVSDPEGLLRRVDLHTHTTASDGTKTPGELIALAAESGLAALAVTDHDTIAGLDAAVAAGKAHGVEVVRGCELAVHSPYGEIHLLGLWLPENPHGLEAALERTRAERRERGWEMVEKFHRAGYDVSREDLPEPAAGESTGRPHLARLLVRKGICASVREAFVRFLADGGPMYVPRPLPAPEEGLALLRGAGAVTVFAHPMLLRAPADKLEGIVARLAALGLDALEAHHSDHDARAVRRAESLAERYKLAISGGSDYHGSVRPDVALGTGRGNVHISYAMLENLRALRRSR